MIKLPTPSPLSPVSPASPCFKGSTLSWVMPSVPSQPTTSPLRRHPCTSGPQQTIAETERWTPLYPLPPPLHHLLPSLPLFLCSSRTCRRRTTSCAAFPRPQVHVRPRLLPTAATAAAPLACKPHPPLGSSSQYFRSRVLPLLYCHTEHMLQGVCERGTSQGGTRWDARQGAPRPPSAHGGRVQWVRQHHPIRTFGRSYDTWHPLCPLEPLVRHRESII